MSRVWSRCLLLLLTGALSAQADQNFRVCVTDENKAACESLIKEGSSKGLKLSCVHVRDRVECLEKILSRDADFSPVEPEDMFVAAKMPNQAFSIIKEIRSKDNLNEDHRYEAVAVVHSTFTISNIQELKGRNSCHTGVGRTVGFKIPVTKLSQLGVLEPLTSDEELTPRELELRALSRAFHRACIVGKWAPDVDTNQRLKTKYSNLCALCENPEKCDYPDNYAGYDGALRCLNERGGDVAWTKVAVVRSFFGLSEASNPNADPSKFAYLCMDGSLKPITAPACSWAARPWLGYIARNDRTDTIGLQRQISLMAELSSSYGVLGLSDTTTVVDRAPISPQDFLSKSRYNDVIERTVGANTPLKLCVSSELEKRKCEAMSSVAYSRDVRPRISCELRDSCLEAVQNKLADAVILDPKEAYDASRHRNLHAVMGEAVPVTWESEHFAIAVRNIKKTKNMHYVQDYKTCHPKYNDLTGWSVPLATLMEADKQCNLGQRAADYFRKGSCAPGAPQPFLLLCDLCTEKGSGCPASDAEVFYGEKGALKCLASASGDVAYLKASTLEKYFDGASNETWANNLKSEDYELICKNGSSAPLSDFRNCHLARIPPRLLMTSNYEVESRVESLRMAFLSISKLFSEKPHLFRLYGPFEGQSDLIFRDAAKELEILDPDLPMQRELFQLLDRLENNC